MCGIAGVLTPSFSIDPRIVGHFQKTLAHRGPDDEGVFQKLSFEENAEPSVLLFHRRLSIVDIAQGHQPFIFPMTDGNYLALIVNGEIYNFDAIRKKYSEFPFKTSSDCESILPLYLDKGIEFMPHLQGMFSLALYDSRTQSLILGRDPFGMKPLYFRNMESAFLFASEIPALTFPFAPNPLDKNIQQEALHRQYTSGAPTLFQEITRVLPGQTMVIDSQLHITTTQAPLMERPSTKSRFFLRSPKPSLPETLKTFEALLLQTVESHLLSDVPVGLFFSGGVDSSIILKALNMLGHNTVPAFHIRFEDEPPTLPKDMPLKASLNELLFTEQDFWELLPLGAFVMDDFAADYAVLPTLKLAQAAKNAQIPVILSGEGGDEIFAGYGRYKKHGSWRPWASSLFRHKSLLYNLPLPSQMLWYQSLLTTESVIQKSLLTPLQKAQLMDLTTWLPDDLMIKLDRTLMHYGLEGRPPFLDKAMASFGFNLPSSYKIQNKEGKWLLKYWLSQVEPTLNFFIKKKGFTPPIHKWLERKAEFLKKTLPHQEALSSLIPPHHTLHLIDRLSWRQGDKRTGLAVWILLYTVWYKIHVQEHLLFTDSVFDLLKTLK